MKRLLFVALQIAIFGGSCLTVALANEPFKVGLSLPMSGSNADVGNASRNGIELAKRAAPASFRNISFVFGDNQYDAKVAISDFHKFVKKDGAHLVFIWGSPTCMAVAPIAESARLPLACLSGDPKPGLKHVFSFNSMATDYAAVALANIQSQDAKRISIVHVAVPFLTNVANELSASLTRDRRELLEVSVNPDATDLRTEVLKLKSFAPDFLVLLVLPSQLKSIANEMSLYKLKPYILGADTFADRSVSKATNGFFTGASYVDMVIPAEFIRQYQEEFGNTSNVSFAYNTFRFAQMVGDLFGNNEAVTPSAVAEKIRSYRGVSESPHSDLIFKDSEENGQYFQFPIGIARVP